MSIRRWLLGLATSLIMALSTSSVEASPTCPNASLFGGGALVNICWTCFFPITIGRVPIGTDLVANVPVGSAAPTCLCPGRLFGLPTWGATVGMWQPTHITEVVRQPWCSPTLGGALSNAGTAGAASGFRLGSWGGYGSEDDGEESNEAFYNVHWFAFPAGVVLDVIQDSYCFSDLGVDPDLLWVSEIDPLWNNDELALFTIPEAIIFANPVAIAACMADSVAATVKQPLPFLFWCFGEWGTAYPHTGNINTQASPPRDTSLIAAKFLAALHRRGLAWKAMGDTAVCRDHPQPIIPKNQYKYQIVYPIPERLNNHWIGSSTYRWGEWRNIPGIGEDFVYINWTRQECCLNF